MILVSGAPDDKEQVSDSPTKKRKPASYADEIAQYKSSRTGESQVGFLPDLDLAFKKQAKKIIEKLSLFKNLINFLP